MRELSETEVYRDAEHDADISTWDDGITRVTLSNAPGADVWEISTITVSLDTFRAIARAVEAQVNE